MAQEIPSIIIDSGSHTTRAGFSGEEVPKLIFPSFINPAATMKFGIESLTRPTAQPEALWEVAQQPNGKHARVAKSKENVEALFEYIFSRLGVNKDDPTTLAPVLIVDPQPPYTPETQSFIAQTLFEKFNIPGVYFAASAVLNAFAAGKHSAIVVDIGAGGTSVVGVSEGLVSVPSWQPLGGDYLNAACLRLLTELGLAELHVHEQIQSKEPVEMGKPPVFILKPATTLTPEALEYQRQRLLEDWKASVAQIAEFASSEPELALKPPKFYEFPDGYNRNYGAERFRIGELLMGKDAPEGIASLVEQIERVHSAVDSHSASIIIVSGGGSLLDGLGERLSNELGARLQRGYGRGGLKVSHAGSALERHHACWIGGSILTSVGSFHKIWVSKQEFADGGMAAFAKRPYASHLALP